MTTKQITRIAIFSALAFAIRIVFSQLPNVQPVSALFFVLIIVFGYFEGILIMMITMLISSFLLGFGPWVFWQMTAFTIVLSLWYYLAYPLTKKVKRHQLLIQSIIVCLGALLYGILMDLFFSYIYSMPWLSYVLSGLPYSINHGIASLIAYPLFVTILRRFTNEKM